MILLHVCHLFNTLDIHLLNRKHKVGRGSKSAASSSRTSSLQHLHVVARSNCSTRTTLLTAIVALHALCQPHSTTTVHTTCNTLLHTPHAAQYLVHISHCTVLLGTGVHRTNDRGTTHIHTKGLICTVYLLYHNSYALMNRLCNG